MIIFCPTRQRSELMKLINYSKDDINYNLAKDAHRGTSFVPEKRAKQEQQGYVNHLDDVVNTLSDFVTEDNQDAIIADLERYRDGYIKRQTALLSARSRCLSSMITGPSNFPVRRNQKANDVADRRLNELLEYSKNVLDKLKSKYDPVAIANAPISSDDPDAIEKLQAKLTKRVKRQEFMKAANRIVRRKAWPDDKKVKELGKLRVGEKTARRFIEDGQGFPRFQLSNNNANIKRIKERIASLEKKQAVADSLNENPVTEYPGNIRLIENYEENRVQIKFPGKPSVEVRDSLKRRGFRWSRSQGAWQRKLTANGVDDATRILKRVTEIE